MEKSSPLHVLFELLFVHSEQSVITQHITIPVATLQRLPEM